MKTTILIAALILFVACGDIEGVEPRDAALARCQDQYRGNLIDGLSHDAAVQLVGELEAEIERLRSGEE